jgi:guanylate kinase
VTTRAPRPSESERDYRFVDRETFSREIAAGAFLEWATVAGELYGTPLPDGPADRDLLLEIDVQGARRVREIYRGATLVLLVAPSEEVTRARLVDRGDSPAAIETRLELGRREVALGRDLADEVVVNEDLDQAVDELVAIVERARRAEAGQLP